MALRTIIIGAGTPILRQKAERVSSFGKEFQKLLKDLRETAEHVKGAGLAAPQVDVSLAVTVARLSGEFTPLINPEIIWRSEETLIGEEGCLSLPDIWVHVPRAKEIIIRSLDEKGREQERKLRDVDARVAQHEIDHLNGKLIVDYAQGMSRTS